MRMLLSAPFEDVASSISAHLASAVDELAERRGFEVIRLYDGRATRLHFFLANFRNPDFIFYSGHGLPERCCGIGAFGCFPFICFLDWSNAGWVRDKVLFLFACHTGLKLAPLLVERGAKAVFANTYYTFTFFPERGHDYLRDEMDVLLSTVDVLFRGGTCGEAIETWRRKWTYYIDLYERNPNWTAVSWYITNAKAMRETFKLYGEPTATII